MLNTTPLGAAGTFTSDEINGEKYGRITGKVYSDKGGSLAIQQADSSPTNTPLDWDTVATVAVTGGTPAAFDIVMYCKFARLVYTNGEDAQTSFRLSGYLGPRGG